MKKDITSEWQSFLSPQNSQELAYLIQELDLVCISIEKGDPQTQYVNALHSQCRIVHEFRPRNSTR